MEPIPRDDEFIPPAEPRAIVIDHFPERYLRLVANPFLGFFGLIVWLALVILFVRHAKDLNGASLPPLILALVLPITQIDRLFQYHCLDCGATGRLSRWRRHACPAAAERHRLGRPRRRRGPSPPLQVMLWLWLLLATAVLLAPRF